MDTLPVELDERRGMAAQRATEIRRRLAQVQADQAALRARHEEFEHYLLHLYSLTPDADDPRRRLLIATALDEITALSGEPGQNPQGPVA
jgi:hypothetical protein